MKFVHPLVFLLCAQPTLAAGIETLDQRSKPRSLQDKIVRWIRPSISHDEQALRELNSRLGMLPPLSPGRRGASAGYHSRFYDSASTAIDLVLDLGKVRRIDRVAVFSVSAVFQGETVPGYGFPRRFRIEVSEDSGFESPVLLLDSSDSMPVTRPEFPVQATANGLAGRYLRFRVLEQWARGDGRFLTALGEIMVLSGGRNVAIGAGVDAETFTSLPDWSLENLVDGQTDLGLPIGPEPSKSNGFLSKPQKRSESDKWVQLELASKARIEEVRFIPAVPFDAPNQHAHGFPRRFRVLAATTPDFASPQVIADHTEVAFPNPGDNPVIIPAGDVTAKYIRLEADELWHISNMTHALALAEMQVYQDGQNIAGGATVTASDIFNTRPFVRVWKPKFLVDGFSSQNRLIELDQWLEGLNMRAALEQQSLDIQARVSKTMEATTNMLLWLFIAVIAALAGLTGMTLVRRKRALVKQRDEMRSRISRDLHDDLGSRLGGMRLISESLLKHADLSSSVRGDLDLIHRASGEATDAMRDIVWLLDNRERSRSKLVRHMRQMAPSVLGSIEIEFTVDETRDQQLDFDFRRHILFAFKESLGNAAKHAGARRVGCHIGGGEKRFTFEVCDDGQGFVVKESTGGHGLENLRSRAETLDGTVSVCSRPGEGTRVVFDAPVRISQES